MSDTIYALASAAGAAGVAVIRASGPAARSALERLVGAPAPAPRMASLRRLRDPRDGSDIDEGLVLWFAGPASYTGEDVAEFHLHGGAAVVEAMMTALGSLESCRMAEPGEFTRRAFENGKLDLTSAEAVADLVAAETAAQRQQALSQYDGALATLYDEWRRQLTQLLARTETAIDFSDEDLPPDVMVGVQNDTVRIQHELARYLNDNKRGERVRGGFRVAIVGAPNVGKSSLLNRIAARDAAIVSEIAGTTRDVIEVHLRLGGYAVIVADTAGIREAEGAIEAEGVRRARQSATDADMRIVVFDGAALPEFDRNALNYVRKDDIILLNKIDIIAIEPPDTVNGQEYYSVSAKTGRGIDAFLAKLTATVQDRLAAGERPPLTRGRHRAALEACAAALARAASAPLPELAADDIRLAVRSLGTITGRVDVEDVLDVIFREFCIGK